MSKLEQHKKEKEKKVNGWDIISTGLGLGAMALIATSFIQAKNPVNALRLPVAFGLLAGSVAAEKLRESDLLSLDRTLDYEKNIQTELLKLDTTLSVTARELQIAEEAYATFPVDRWEVIHQRTGIAPPNLEMRKADPLIQTIDQPQAQSKDQSAELPNGMRIDPWDEPEDQSVEETEEPKIRSSFIPKERVDQWFAEMGDHCPESLKNEWQTTANPVGIEIVDNEARILKNG